MTEFFKKYGDNHYVILRLNTFSSFEDREMKLWDLYEEFKKQLQEDEDQRHE